MLLIHILLLRLQCVKDGYVPMFSYVFESKEVALKHQGLYIESIESEVKVNSSDCMTLSNYVTNPYEMLLDLLILDQKDLWWKMRSADNIFNLFDKST